jgi:two-component system, response regulator
MQKNEKGILLVEDNPDDEELTMMALDESNILNKVTVAHDGTEALDYLFGTGKFAGRSIFIPPQIVLLDLKLPKMGGLEVLKRMRADPRTQFIPVVVLTSSSEEEDIISSYQLGANSYVRKPIEFHRFANAVRQLGLFWLLLNETPNPKL